MKKENKPLKEKIDTSKKDHVNQNIYDFNPSQFTTEEELEMIKKRKDETKRKDDKDKSKEKGI